MAYMVMRRCGGDGATPSGAPLPVPGITLRDGADAVRLLRRNGQWRVEAGPFPPAELVDAFALLEAASLPEAIAQVRAWPGGDDATVYELREAGCAGGCAGFDERGTVGGNVPRRDPALTRYVFFIRADDVLEQDLVPPPEVIAAMNRHNEQGVRDGVLLAGEGLKSSARGARVRLAAGASTVVDGPFTEVKELIAGYWMLQAGSPEAALDCMRRYPYPGDGDVTLEMHRVREPAAAPGGPPER
ncbi:hypothetical protein H3H37_23980 [Duganella sp. LX20W]|uniref:YCII-related domain-containing protein n=1 Tax=Rugamonas brunnea TaxID=2758569 RepID=A0A7W2EWY1_9BURK|nr:YciI family protein [Rugamonas brunnea]MBA5640127.1 hypothetical protein [Rugamonas brunnea]